MLLFVTVRALVTKARYVRVSAFGGESEQSDEVDFCVSHSNRLSNSRARYI
jgi:hypothetical protein